MSQDSLEQELRLTLQRQRENNLENARIIRGVYSTGAYVRYVDEALIEVERLCATI